MAHAPEQVGMEKHKDEIMPNTEPVLLSGASRASPLATASYVLIAVGHILILVLHARETSSQGQFFLSLAVVELALAWEAAVLALGAFGRRSGLLLLTLAGRFRLLSAAMAWPWLLPWGAELACRCGVASTSTGAGLLQHGTLAAVLVDAFFGLREVSFLFKGEPVSAINSAAPAQVGDCLPSQAVLGGQFRMDKADLEETGRAVFVPARTRHGLFVGSGLAMLAHLVLAFGLLRVAASPPWLLLGALVALLGRRWGELPTLKAKGEKDDGESKFSPWRREGPRLTCRLGELFWIWCCLLELQRCEATPGWLAACE